MRMSISASKGFSRIVRRVIGTRKALVTNGWNVSSSFSEGALTLSLFKTGGKLGGKFYHHPMDGFRFDSHEQLDAWLIENGFLVPHYRATWCSVCRVAHKFCHARTPGCALSGGGKGYVGCVEAQAEWDAEDITWSKRTCSACGEVKWEANWIQKLTVSRHGRPLCLKCSRAAHQKEEADTLRGLAPSDPEYGMPYGIRNYKPTTKQEVL